MTQSGLFGYDRFYLHVSNPFMAGKAGKKADFIFNLTYNIFLNIYYINFIHFVELFSECRCKTNCFKGTAQP